MEVKVIKEILSEDPDKIIKLLRSLGFHDFSENSEEIRCALPDKVNSSAVMVKKNKSLYTALFELGFNGDLFGAIQLIKKCSFTEALQYVSSILGLSTTSEVYCDPLKELKTLSQGKDIIPKQNKLYSENILNQFIPVVHHSLIEEGIGAKVINQFNILFDVDRQRIVFPHYDWMQFDKIVGIKGRTFYSQEEIDILGVPKYWNYIKGYRKMLNLYGYSQAYKGIESKKKIILFEGEKSVLKEFTFEKGQGCSVALGGHSISDAQVEFILKNTPNDCEVILAFDKDVWNKDEEGISFIKQQAAKFQPFRQVSAIEDRYNILGEKDSPIDKGYKVWNYLLKWRKKLVEIKS